MYTTDELKSAIYVLKQRKEAILEEAKAFDASINHLQKELDRREKP